ncbi:MULTISPECIES: hypothetical protein [Sulfitobacter]|jgi:hypothetical protein|uniref:Uncharacterized protein n=1 Tax=Sulfitobacter dubius TaxID=218673 RepID=A0ABY3ZJM5_9RHOB|nr:MULTISPECIES: hypothetical protein [Sulfitobacter]UOA14845.1 hypothetical protein DSM109990_01656 [Sulfitobacter dubius]WOI29707.1 hypothetical protein R1T39_03090 [Sulfitobacter dubius]
MNKHLMAVPVRASRMGDAEAKFGSGAQAAFIEAQGRFLRKMAAPVPFKNRSRL